MRMLKVLAIAVVFLLSSSSCGSVSMNAGRATIGQDLEIDSSIRQTIHELNQSVLDSIKQADLDGLLRQFASVSKEGEKDNREAFQKMVERAQGKTFSVWKDYYWTWQGLGRSPVATIADSEGFRISAPATGDDIFVSLMVTQGQFNEDMLILIYSQQDGRWKPYNSRLGILKTADKNAMDWYGEAALAYERGYLLPAVLKMQLANNLLDPAGFFHYEAEDVIASFYKKVSKEINDKYSFPILVTEIESKPVIYWVEPQFVKKDMLVRFKYVSQYSQEDTSMLEKEANAMYPVVQTLFPGIAEEPTHIVFSAFSEPPVDTTKTYRYYNTVVEVSRFHQQ